MNNKLNNIKIPLSTECGVCIGDDLYLFSMKYNLLYKINTNDCKIEFESYIPNEGVTANFWFKKALFWKDRIIFVPVNAKKVWIYSIYEKRWESILIDNCDVDLKFTTAFIVDDHLFCFGFLYQAVLDIDLKTKEFRHIEEKVLKDSPLFGEDRYNFSGGVQINNTLYITSEKSNYILKLVIDSDTFESEWYAIGEQSNRYTGAIYDDGWFWLIPRYVGDIVKWNGKKEWKAYSLPSSFISGRKDGFKEAIIDGENIELLTCVDGCSIIIDNNGKMSSTEKTNAYSFVYIEGKDKYISLQNDGSLVIKKKDSLIKKSIVCTLDEIVSFWKASEINLCLDKLIKENAYFSLDAFLDMI